MRPPFFPNSSGKFGFLGWVPASSPDHRTDTPTSRGDDGCSAGTREELHCELRPVITAQTLHSRKQYRNGPTEETKQVSYSTSTLSTRPIVDVFPEENSWCPPFGRTSVSDAPNNAEISCKAPSGSTVDSRPNCSIFYISVEVTPRLGLLCSNSGTMTNASEPKKEPGGRGNEEDGAQGMNLRKIKVSTWTIVSVPGPSKVRTAFFKLERCLWFVRSITVFPLCEMSSHLPLNLLRECYPFM